MSVRSTFLEAAATVPEVVEAVAQAWARPSALDGWSVGGLAGHFARGLGTVVGYVGAAPPSGGTAVDAPGYFLHFDMDDPTLSAAVLQRGIDAGETGPDAVAARARDDLALVTRAVGDSAADRQLAVFGGLVMGLDEYLRTRLVELVVHRDDLEVSVGGSLPAMPQAAVDEALAVLVAMAERKHGPLPVIRALARRERARSIAVF
jgi:uncharacterized protein (TIGR03083 family)